MREAEKPSLRAASCCSVEVVNGGAGLRLRCLWSTLSARRAPSAAARMRSRAAAAAREEVRVAPDPSISEAYRAEMVENLVGNALETAIERAGGDR